MTQHPRRRAFALMFALSCNLSSTFPSDLNAAEPTAESTEEDAHPGNEEPELRFKQKTLVDFEDRTIRGELTGPAGSFSLSRSNQDFHPFIRIKRNFDAEMNRSVLEVR